MPIGVSVGLRACTRVETLKRSSCSSARGFRGIIAKQQAELEVKERQAAELEAERERRIDASLKYAGRNRVRAVEALAELLDVPATPPKQTRDKNGNLVLKKDGTPKVRFIDRDEGDRMARLVEQVRCLKKAAEDAGVWPAEGALGSRDQVPAPAAETFSDEADDSMVDNVSDDDLVGMRSA